MYSVMGVPLDNPAMGWVFRSLSRPRTPLQFARPSVQAEGVDGVKPLLSYRVEAPVVTLVVQTLPENLETLVEMVTQGWYMTRDDGKNWVADYECMSATPDDKGYAGAPVDVTFALRIPGVYWFDAATVTTTPVALGSASVTAGPYFAGSSAPIQEMFVRVRGQFSGLRVTDASGSWFTYDGTVPAGSYLRLSVGSMRAWVTTTDTWDGGTEVSGLIDYGGPRNVFEAVPIWTTEDPGNRAVSFTVATTSRSSAQFQVRGRGAHII